MTFHRKRLLLLAAVAALSPLAAQTYTRGVGVYPGDPREDWSPSFAVDSTTYRNLALHRPAYQSSAYDYNLTAQLVTDGIRATRQPRWIAVRTSQQGVVPKTHREFLFDDNWWSTVDLNGTKAWVELEWGGEAHPEIDRVELEGTLEGRPPENQEWAVVLSASDDGKAWKELGRTFGMAHPTAEWKGTIAWPANSSNAARGRFYRFDFESGRPVEWHVAEARFYHGRERVHAGGPYDFTSAWRSAGAGNEWVSVDLGAECTFDRVALYWLHRAAAGEIQISDDGKTWRTLEPLAANGGPTDDIHLSSPAHARWVRLWLARAQGDEPYILSEFEVWGRGGPVPKAKPAPAAASADGRLQLSGGKWSVERASQVHAAGAALSTLGFGDSSWTIATVPATVISSWWNAGALPDPNFGANQLAISDSFFCSDFWYRDEFIAPNLAPGRRAFLDFDGVNWKAEVFLNGQRLGRIDGGFLRARFDVTALLHPGRANALAVRVEKLDAPGSVKEKTFHYSPNNGGATGADSPTYSSSVGWDWIPTVRGRDTGIWADVYLSQSGAVTVEYPEADTVVLSADGSSADMHIETTLVNRTAVPVSGTLRGKFGDAAFEQAVNLAAHETRVVKLDVADHPTLHLNHPKLWWPNGYGEQNLYPLEVSFETGGVISDRKTVRAGVRRFTYSEDNHTLRIWINGRRFVGRGGSWGFPESMLRYRAREYDVAVGYHQDQNFTMIRNWVGQTGDDSFYDACDKHGIVVWQDFWLANPFDGPDPNDPAMFLANARNYVLKIRHHASVGLYVGRNEGYPPDPIERGLRSILAELAPGIHYIPSSADDVVSGHGPYRAMPPRYYFAERATAKMHSELGMPDIVSLDSLRAMMPENDLWPQNDDWGMHDFPLPGAQSGASFRERIDTEYGGAKDVVEWVELAQFIDYDGYRAMFEAQSRNRMGMLLWMSHSAWPSLVWQTYDYYFDVNGGYFGSKKGSEPLHVQWNPVGDNVEVVNYSDGNQTGLTVSAQILNLNGKVQWEKSATVDSNEDSDVTAFHLDFPAALTPVHFIRLKLERGGAVISDNFYMRGTEENRFAAIRTLPKVTVEANTAIERRGEQWVLTTELHNTSAQPALMVRVKAIRERSGDRILPALYSDNYVALMPDERKTIVTKLEDADTRGERPRIVVEGFNLLRR